MTEFVIPRFLQDSGTDEIHARMLSNVTDNIDKSEGSVVWDLTRTPAMEMSETVEFVIVEAIKSMFPMWATGKMLDYHGENRGLKRRSASKATGTVTFHGTEGYVIKAGTLLSTTSESDEETILFVTLEEGVLAINGDDAMVEIPVEAVTAGLRGNVAAGRINRLDTTNENVLYLSNLAATTGGLDVESDESYRERVVEYDQTQGESFIGSVADYKRWALSVVGVGGASVIPPEDDSGIVRIIITDSEGNPAPQELCTEVYNYIMRPDNPSERLASINALLEVVSSSPMKITITARIETNGVRPIEAIKSDVLDKLKEYYTEAVEDGEIKYSRICAILISTDGVEDYTNVSINGSTANIDINTSYLPYSDDSSVTLTVAG